MNNYNDDYYISFKATPDQQYVSIRPDDKTGARKYNMIIPEPGSQPFFFINRWKEKDNRRGVKRNLSDVFVASGSGWLVSNKVYDVLVKFNSQGVKYHPAVYIDDEGNWHEGYWFVGFYDRIDCVDKNLSTVSEKIGNNVVVDKYVLDQNVLDQVLEENRMMFMTKGDMDNYIFCHKTLVDALSHKLFNGVRFIKVSDYEIGIQNDPHSSSFIQFS